MKKVDLPQFIIILRNYQTSEVMLIASLLHERLPRYGIEIPLSSSQSLVTLAQLKADFPDLIVGAGTVVNLVQLKEVAALDVNFVLSPIAMSKEMLAYCDERAIISIPGAFTPTEIKSAIELKADIVKIFPITSLADTYLTDIQAPLGKLKLMAVGGVTIENANWYLKNGASYLGIGSGIFNITDIQASNYAALKQSLDEFERALE